MMNKSLVRYGVSLAVALVAGAITFPAVLHRMGYQKKSDELDIVDIPEDEIDPDVE